ncbi:MAG: hypothetical protein WKF78_01630 [Candidatus Limnocylindrales bacterium]
MAARFPDQREAILNSRRIAEMTDLSLPLGQLRIPHFPVPDGAHRRDRGCARSASAASPARYGTVTARAPGSASTTSSASSSRWATPATS